MQNRIMHRFVAKQRHGHERRRRFARNAFLNRGEDRFLELRRHFGVALRLNLFTGGGERRAQVADGPPGFRVRVQTVTEGVDVAAILLLGKQTALTGAIVDQPFRFLFPTRTQFLEGRHVTRLPEVTGTSLSLKPAWWNSSPLRVKSSNGTMSRRASLS